MGLNESEQWGILLKNLCDASGKAVGGVAFSDVGLYEGKSGIICMKITSKKYNVEILDMLDKLYQFPNLKAIFFYRTTFIHSEDGSCILLIITKTVFNFPFQW